MEVREMASSVNGRFFIAAAFEKQVMVFNAESAEKLGEYNTHFEFGGQRISITNSGEYFASAAYGRYGVSLYETATGNCLWTNKEIKRIQCIYFSDDDKILNVVNADDSLFMVSTADGTIIEKRSRISKLYVSGCGKVYLNSSGIIQWENDDIKTEEKVYKLCRSADKVYASILGGGLLCFNINGDLVWSTKNKTNEHFVDLSYNENMDILFAIGYKYDCPRTKPYRFVNAYKADTGDLIFTDGFGDAIAWTFINSSSEVVSDEGLVYSLTGKNISPEKKYHFD